MSDDEMDVTPDFRVSWSWSRTEPFPTALSGNKEAHGPSVLSQAAYNGFVTRMEPFPTVLSGNKEAHGTSVCLKQHTMDS